MIELPSTTRVDRKIPKERFYENLKLTNKQRESFVRLVDAIVIANSIKQTTMRIHNGTNVHEIFLIDIALKEQCFPSTVIEVIAKNNSHEILFRCQYAEDELYAVYRQGRAWCTDWVPADKSQWGSLSGDNLDELWDSICSQVIFDDTGIIDVDEEIRKRQKIKVLDDAIAKLERTHGKEKQLRKRNALFEKLQDAKTERDSLLKG